MNAIRSHVAEGTVTQSDIDDLLAEVNRLTAQDHKWAYVLGRGHERLRIAEAIKTLRHAMDDYSQERRLGFNEGLAAALALLEGEACQHRTWLTMDPPVCAGCGMVGDR